MCKRGDKARQFHKSDRPHLLRNQSEKIMKTKIFSDYFKIINFVCPTEWTEQLVIKIIGYGNKIKKKFLNFMSQNLPVMRIFVLRASGIIFAA